MKTFEIFAKFDCKRNGKQVGVCPLINYDMQETAKVIAKSIIAMGYADDFMVREKKSGEDVTGLVQTIIDEIMEEQKTQEKEVVERYIYVTRKDGGIVLLSDARKFEPTSYRYARSLDHRSMTIFVPSGNIERQVLSYKAMDKEHKYIFKELRRTFIGGDFVSEKLLKTNL
jgi:hypothetical protein